MVLLSAILAVIGAAVLAQWWNVEHPTTAATASPRAPSAASTQPTTRATSDAPVSPWASAKASFVGTAACAKCHESSFDAWRTSQHAVAMQAANDRAVQGDFNNEKFRYGRIESTFFKRDGKFFVRTDGPAGALADYEVAYTFGVDPLQQYLIPFADGRLQALSIAWDTRPARQGGQRWFHLYPGQGIDHRDPLHWTRDAQNWNFMCAECHVTGFEKNYDAAANRYASRWTELGVGCESCHGPASIHVAWADARAAGKQDDVANKGLVATLDERAGVTWKRSPDRDTATRSVPRTDEHEIEVCAQCHARRAPIAAGYTAGARFLDYYLPALLEPGVYHADGQQRAEVYIWGSFLQSRMYAAGVTCSDCHEPHSAKLRAQGNALCDRCHDAAKFDTTSHHHHASGSAGAQCVNCHMPANAYMQVDPRRDHGLRPPRPDLTVAVGTPNACNACHRDRDARWAAARVKALWGDNPDRLHRYASAFAAADDGATDASAALRAVVNADDQPAIARASALARLDANRGSANLEAIANAAHDRSALVRLGAVESLTHAPPDAQRTIGTPLLSDPFRAVRIEAAKMLAGEIDGASAQQRSAFEAAATEFVASQRYNADRPEARTALGTFEVRMGDFARGVEDLRSSIALDPAFAGAYLDLADAFRDADREADADATLREGLSHLPRDAALHHALGLSLVRAKRSQEALAELAQATKLEPANARFAYVLGVAQHSFGDARAAIATLESASRAHPADREIVEALVSFHREAGDRVEAERFADRLRALGP
ncbi:MAG TPA: cytochrome c3 family protein [Casimicrobiaceae bacterium]